MTRVTTPPSTSTNGPPATTRARLARLGLSTLAAALLWLSVPTANAWPLMWIALVPQLHVALTSRTAKRAFLQGWLTGTLANTVAFYWMDGLLERFGHMSPLEALPIVLLLTAYQGLEFALLSWGVYRLRARTGARVPVAVAAMLVMATIELAMPQIFPFYLAISQAWVPARDPDRRPHGAHRRHGAARGVERRARRRVASARAPGGAAPRCARSAVAARSSPPISSTARCACTRSTPRARPRPRSRRASCRPTSASSRSGTRRSSPSCSTRTSASRPSSRARAPSSSSGPSRRTRTRCRARSRTSGPRAIRAACAWASTRRCSSARSRAPRARRRGPPTSTPTTRRS